MLKVRLVKFASLSESFRSPLPVPVTLTVVTLTPLLFALVRDDFSRGGVSLPCSTVESTHMQNIAKQDPNPAIFLCSPCTNTPYYVFAQGYTKQVL